MSVSERDPLLAKIAKEEGQLTLYTVANNFTVLGDAFEKKYGVKVNVYNISTDPLVLRVRQEEEANRLGADVVDLTQPPFLSDDGIASYLYPGLKYDQSQDLIPNAVGKGYVADRVNVFAVTWNKNLVPDNEVPQNVSDLVDPKYKGKLFVANSDSDWYAALVQYYEGQGKSRADAGAIVDGLIKNSAIAQDHGTLISLLAAGQYEFSLDALLSTSSRNIAKGAPIAYTTADDRVISPLVLVPCSMGVFTKAQHPAAALLFLDYTLSAEGQQILVDNGNLGSSTVGRKSITKYPSTVADMTDFAGDPSYDADYKAALASAGH